MTHLLAYLHTKLVTTLAAALALVFSAASARADSLPEGAQIARRCASCHGLYGQARHPFFPHLAGQHKNYLIRQLEAFAAGERKFSAMETIAASLSRAEIEAVSAYYSEIKPFADSTKDQCTKPEGP